MANLADLAQKHGIKVLHIECSQWGKGHTSTEAVEANGADTEFMSELEPTHIP